MSTKKKKNKAGKTGNGERKEWLKPLVVEGEKLGNAFIERLVTYGSDPKGLFIETYALAKAWGSLKAVAASRDCDVEQFFNTLVPMFEEETEDAIKVYEEAEK